MKDLLKYVLILLLFLSMGMAKSESTGSQGGYPVYNYQNGTLTIPRVDIPDQVGRYQDVVFQFDQQLNAWVLQDLNSRDRTAMPEMVLVTGPSVFIPDSRSMTITVEFTVTGRITCGRLGQINQRRTGNLFEIQITQEPLAPNEVCDQIARTFVRTIYLDVNGLKAGEYRLNVIGREITHSFTIPFDTTPPSDCGGSPEEDDPTIICGFL